MSRRTSSSSDPDGKQSSSRDLLAKGPLVSRSIAASGAPTAIWSCRRCRRRCRSPRAARAWLRSRRRPRRTAASRCAKQALFPILSDVKSEVGDAFGLRFKLPDYLVELYKSLQERPADVQRRSELDAADARRYVIGQDGMIPYSEVNPDYTHRPDPSELLPVLDRLRTGKAA